MYANKLTVPDNNLITKMSYSGGTGRNLTYEEWIAKMYRDKEQSGSSTGRKPSGIAVGNGASAEPGGVAIGTNVHAPAGKVVIGGGVRITGDSMEVSCQRCGKWMSQDSSAVWVHTATRNVNCGY